MAVSPCLSEIAVELNYTHRKMLGQAATWGIIQHCPPEKRYLSAGYGSLSLDRLIHGSKVDPHAERKYEDLQVLLLEA
jgi:hypothetical protein